MTISDALPVQFWFIGCYTYNETVPQGVHYACWLQPWECDDEIRVQFLYSSGDTFTLEVKDEEGNSLAEFDFNEVYPGVYEAAFIPQDEDICDIKIQLFINSDGSPVAKSDGLDIAAGHDETILLTYSNHRNFDGLSYENNSPDTTFNIRIPCRFYHEVEPEEDEAMELTSSIITTSSQVKTQRLLEIKHAPYYFHKKLRRVLKHQTVTIFDKQWEKEEKYEVMEGKKTWPLKAATCLLTEKNSVVRNVL